MCNRFMQNGREVKPGERATVLMRGPGGAFEVEVDNAVFSGAARADKRKYWLASQKADEVIVPGISRFGEKDKTTGVQNYEDVTPDSTLEGLLLPQPAGKDYRLLKVVTQDATAEQLVHLGNDRAPVFTSGGKTVGRTKNIAPAKPEPEVEQRELFG